MASGSSLLKKYLKDEGIYDVDIEEILTDMNVIDPAEDFKTFSQTQWNELYRRTVVERIKQLKNQSSKDRLEKKLKKLEERWREQSGIKRTSNGSLKMKSDDIKQPEYDTIKHAEKKKMLQKASGLKQCQ